MQVSISVGLDHLKVDVPESRLVRCQPVEACTPVADPRASVGICLEHPVGFPALRRALTPDDHIAVVVDERLPHLADLLVPILEHVGQAGVKTDAISLICAPSVSRQEWLESMPDAFEEVRLEVHNPTDRKRLSYLATMRHGRRLYLNRTVVDADQVVVLTGLSYDPLLGQAGAAGALFPALSDQATLQELGDAFSMQASETAKACFKREAAEAAWLLGAPFFVQVIEGPGDTIMHVLGGLADTSAEGSRLQDAQWRRTIGQPADVVIAALGGDPSRHAFADLARAAACAAGVVKANGQIVLLTRATPDLGPAVEVLRQADDPAKALSLLQQRKPLDRIAACQWVQAAEHAQIYLLSGLTDETAEEIFSVPLGQDSDAQRLVDRGGSVLVLDDAHKMLAVLE